MKKLIIVGAGAFGRELFHWCQHHPDSEKHWSIHGFIDDNPHALEAYNYPVPLIEAISTHQPTAENIYICAIAIPKIKEHICDILEGKGAQFLTFIHPSAILGGNISLGTGCVICPRVVMSCDIQVGKFVLLNTGTTIGHDVKVGDYSTTYGNVELTGGVTFGKRVLAGSHATTNPKSVVGDDATLGLGSAVIGRVQAGKTVLGIPARPI